MHAKYCSLGVNRMPRSELFSRTPRQALRPLSNVSCGVPDVWNDEYSAKTAVTAKVLSSISEINPSITALVFSPNSGSTSECFTSEERSRYGVDRCVRIVYVAHHQGLGLFPSSFTLSKQQLWQQNVTRWASGRASFQIVGVLQVTAVWPWSTVYPVPRIPPELSDRIIDYLRDDACALSTCSLICKTWLPRTRYNRFNTLVIDARSGGGLLPLLARTPAIQPVVRVLRICYRKKSGIGPARGWIWEGPLLNAVTCMLPNVEQLELDNIDLHACMVKVLQHNLRHVHTLYLTQVHLPGPWVLFMLLMFFTNVRNLYLADVFLHHKPSNDQIAHCPSDLEASTDAQTLTTLRFQSRTSGDIIAPSVFHWLVTCNMHTNITTLQIPDIRKTDVPKTMALLRALGPTLQHLYIGFSDYDRAVTHDVSNGILTLKHCTGLRTLGLWSINLVSPLEVMKGTTHSQQHTWVSELLASCSSSSIEHVHLRIRAGGADYKHLTYFDWARVDSVLCERAHYGALRRLTCEIIRGDSVKETVVPYIKSQLTEMDRREDVIMRFLQRI
ncbi:hypothetical protein BC835DRAFT_1306006 [Cytidiella melzeri]|nr:hypothetical protein BC835DRAFT_1306006 [Cytidiella melzeri]